MTLLVFTCRCNKHNDKAFSLLEAMIAMVVLTLTLVTLAGLPPGRQADRRDLTCTGLQRAHSTAVRSFRKQAVAAVCSAVNVHSRFKSRLALRAVLPGSFMFFGIVEVAQSGAAMISMATVRVIREGLVFVLIVGRVKESLQFGFL